MTPAEADAIPIKEWLEPMIETWRGQVLGAWRGEDGWPARTVLGRIIDEGAGASHGGGSQRVFEVYHGDGLKIRRAIEGMPLGPRQVFVAHYLASGNATSKSAELGIKKSRYWSLLDAAYHYLAGHLEASS